MHGGERDILPKILRTRYRICRIQLYNIQSCIIPLAATSLAMRTAFSLCWNLSRCFNRCLCCILACKCKGCSCKASNTPDKWKIQSILLVNTCKIRCNCIVTEDFNMHMQGKTKVLLFSMLTFHDFPNVC